MITVRWLVYCLAPVALIGSLSTCSSPTGPGPCRNGRDGLGRGPVDAYDFSCAYVGADTIQCESRHSQLGYCSAFVHKDITATTEWLTSNPAAAMFISPGLMKIVGTGQVEIIAKVGSREASGGYVYVVAPGTTPERMINLSVIVRDAANADRRLAGATIQVEPDRGPPQSCLSSSTGHCNFWVFDGRIRVRASLQGYESSEALAVRPWPDGFTLLATLDLRRIR